MITNICDTVICNAASLWIHVLFAMTFPWLLLYIVVETLCGIRTTSTSPSLALEKMG